MFFDGSAAEYSTYKVWAISYQIVFHNTLRGEKVCRTSSGRLTAMTQILLRDERDEYGDLWKEMLAAHEKRLEHEQSSTVIRAARDVGTEKRRRIKRAQILGEKALYVKAAKALAQSPIFYP